jgi:hypothetical protein
MKKMEECAICAWRKDCKMKYSFETSGLYCKDFSRDVSLFPEEKKPGPTKEDKKKPA